MICHNTWSRYKGQYLISDRISASLVPLLILLSETAVCVYSPAPLAMCADPHHCHTCWHYAHAGSSICLIRLWVQVWRGVREREREGERDVCEVFITTGISLPPLIPSLGPPFSYFCTESTTMRVQHLLHPPTIHTVKQRDSHTLKSNKRTRSFSPCHVHTHMH